MPQTLRIAAFTAMFAAAPLTAALADRPPTAEENAMIGNVLFSEGFSSWGRIELDGDEWQVDDAIDQDGRTRDLTLDPTFVIIDED